VSRETNVSNVTCAVLLTFNVSVKHGKLIFRSQLELFICVFVLFTVYRVNCKTKVIESAKNRIFKQSDRLLTSYFIPDLR